MPCPVEEESTDFASGGCGVARRCGPKYRLGAVNTGSRTRWVPHIFNTIKGQVMNKDQVKGAAKEVAGKVQKNVGDAVGSDKQQVKGALREAEGKLQKAYGDAKEQVKRPKP